MKELNEQFNRMVSSAKHLDVEIGSENFSKDEFVSVILGTDYYNNRSEFLYLIKTYFSMRERQQIDSIRVRVTVLSSNGVLVTSEADFKIWLKNGSNFQLKYTFTTLWKKEQESRQVIHAHESWTEKKSSINIYYLKSSRVS